MILIIRVAIPDDRTLDSMELIDWDTWRTNVVRGMVEQAHRHGAIRGDWTLSLTDDLGTLTAQPDKPRWLQGEFRIEAQS